ncbi:unnamed protein product [[Candida] boidinii]|uniref:Unnamed protein product n=1 Tax=Candida boidinii TaxID=5477 RepID=A0A9W6WKY5_CANBO|nr:unnamed protein product [[Candida] boidinii]
MPTFDQNQLNSTASQNMLSSPINSSNISQVLNWEQNLNYPSISFNNRRASYAAEKYINAQPDSNSNNNNNNNNNSSSNGNNNNGNSNFLTDNSFNNYNPNKASLQGQQRAFSVSGQTSSQPQMPPFNQRRQSIWGNDNEASNNISNNNTNTVDITSANASNFNSTPEIIICLLHL